MASEPKPSSQRTQVHTWCEASGWTHIISRAQSQDPIARDAAWAELTPLVMDELRPYLERRAREKGGESVTITAVLNEACGNVAEYLPKLGGVDTGWFRGLFLRVAFRRLTDRLQKNLGRRLVPMETDPSDPAAAPDVLLVSETLKQFLIALADLETQEISKWRTSATHTVPGVAGVIPDTPMADAIRTRYLAEYDIQLLGEQPIQVERFNPTPRTFEVVASILGVTAATACRRFWDGIDWMNLHHPELRGVLPLRKASGKRPRIPGPTETKGGVV